jgi:hypothetical protein
MVLYLAFGVGLAYAMIMDPRDPWAAWAAQFFVLGVFGMSVWLLLFYQRGGLIIAGDRVEAVGVFRRRTLTLSKVHDARWRVNADGGSVALKAEDGRIVVRFGYFENEQRDRLIRDFRAAIPPDRQMGWNLFAYKISSGEPRPRKTKPGDGEVLITRRRWYRYGLAALAVSLPLAGLAWWVTGEARFLAALPAVSLPFWVMRFFTPAHGMVVPRLSNPRDLIMLYWLAFVAVWGLIAIGAILLVMVFADRLSHPVGAFGVIFGVLFTVLIVEALRIDRRRTRLDREAADLAAKERGEAPERVLG